MAKTATDTGNTITEGYVIKMVGIEEYFETLHGKELSFNNIVPIPVSALEGTNIVKRSNETPWYQGPTLLGHLESVDIGIFKPNSPFRFPVQL